MDAEREDHYNKNLLECSYREGGFLIRYRDFYVIQQDQQN